MVKYVKADYTGSDYQQKKLQLERKLKTIADMLMFKKIVNIKEYELAFQNAIENVFDEPWYEATACNIFQTLLETKDAYKTIECILNEMKY